MQRSIGQTMKIRKMTVTPILVVTLGRMTVTPVLVVTVEV